MRNSSAKMTQIQVNVPFDLKDKIYKLAKEHHLSVSAFVRLAILDYIRKLEDQDRSEGKGR